MASNMIENYDNWENRHGFLGLAAVLDLRFKMSLIECYYADIYEDHGVEMIENIKTRYDLLTVYEGKNDKNYSEVSSSPPLSTSSMDSDLKRYALFLNSRKKGKTSHAELELDHCLEEDVLPTCGQCWGILFSTINDDDMDTDEFISDVT
ncbi:hypothetical protein Vadar_002479 [Vaccinium darrowii]|uniref:Uncharacterized protein n=1 Tax=Vaccinium darrowii TaxID=229202 RepID=A0ACB7XWK5_9ERIC|nr:hypothetical protein Vadar_002479 [Vaccinium darrowii]